MDDFQKKVVGVAAVLLILIFASTYYLLNKATKKETWPPTINDCPDYWEYDASHSVCKNNKGLGQNYPSTVASPFDMSFNPLNAVAPTYGSYSNQSMSTNCGKYCFAETYKIPWDGITYGYTNMPCQPKSSSTT